MLYLIGGASRAGKSILGRTMARKYGLSYASIDDSMYALIEGMPTAGIYWEDSEHTKANKMWPYLQRRLGYMAKDGMNYVMDSMAFQPEHTTALTNMGVPFRICWLGYPSETVERKLAKVQSAKGLPNDWLNEKSIQVQRDHLDEQIFISRELQWRCSKQGLQFFDTSSDFQDTLAKAEFYLMEGITHG
ncbi:MAG: hypothetical protein WAZ18_03020 [Alphaproteobacteria bacterium]